MRLVETLGSVGLTVIEVTMEHPGACSMIEALSGLSAVTVGAGTVLSVDAAAAAVDAGAKFLVAPGLVPDIVAWSSERDIPFIPGVLTPTELAFAQSMGVHTVKLFPASLGGSAYLSSLLGPFPNMQIIPTGGVQLTNARSFIDAGAIAIGVGGWLTSHEDQGLVARRASELVTVLAGPG